MLNNEWNELHNDEDEYEKDVILACTALAYAWIFPVGTIAAGVVMGIYSDKAIKMKAAMDGLHSIINDNQGELDADKALVAHVHLVDTEVSRILTLIGPAIKAIEEMMGCWNVIESDLTSIRDFSQDHQSTNSSVVLKLNENIIVRKWNELKAAVDKYRQAAFISDVEVTTIDKWATDAKVPSG